MTAVGKMSSGNATVVTNDSGVGLRAASGAVTLTGLSLQVNASSATLQTPVTLGSSLSVQGASTLGGTTCTSLSTSSAAVSGTLTVGGAATLQTLAVNGGASLQSASVSGPVTAQNAQVSGALTVGGATQLQSTLQVGGNVTVTGQLGVTGQATFGAPVSFGGNVTFATNTSFSCFNQTVQNQLTVQSSIVATGTATRQASLVSTATSAGAAQTELYYDCTAATSGAYAQTRLTPGGGFSLLTGGKPALTTSVANQQTTATANRAGDTFRVAGDGSISTTTEIFLDNSAAQAAQVGRVGCDSSGLYLSPGSASKAVAVSLSGQLNAARGVSVTGGLTSDTISAPSLSAGALAATSASVVGTLTCSAIAAGGSAVLALQGADANKTVSAPVLQTASVVAPSSTALVLAGKDSSLSTKVTGRLLVDLIDVNSSSALTINPPVTFNGKVTSAQTSFGSLAVTAANGTSAQLLLDASASGSGNTATVAAVPGTGLQLAVAGSTIMTANFSTLATNFPNAVTVSGTMTVAGTTLVQGGLNVNGSVSCAGGVAPVVSNAADLGSASNKWRSAYLGTSVVLPNAVFTGKLSELTADMLTLNGPLAVQYNNIRGLTIKNASATASSTADIFFDRSAVASAQTGGIGMGGDTQGLFLATNGVQRINISTTGLVGVGTTPLAPLSLQVGGNTQDFKGNGLYVFNPNTTSSGSSPQNAVITTQVQALNNSANAFHCFDNTQASWSFGMRGGDSRLYFSPSNTSAVASPQLTLDQGGNATFGGGLLIGDGTVSKPAYGFSTDTNNATGFYHPSTSTIGVAVGGVQALQFNNDKSVTAFGNLGVVQNVTAAGANVTGQASIGTLTVSGAATIGGGLTTSGTTSSSDTVISSATTSTGMLRLAGKSSSQAEATLAFNRTGAGSTLWTMGQGTYQSTDDFCIGGGTGQGACLQISAANGYVTLRHGGTSTSDRSLKKDICPLNDGLDVIENLHPVRFRWRKGGDSARHMGFIAQDVQEVLPEGVVHSVPSDDGRILTIGYTELIAPLVDAVQRLSAEVRDLKTRLPAASV